MLDPARKKCDLHIRAAGIFLMQLELLEIRRLVALCHNEGANVDEDRILATASTNRHPFRENLDNFHAFSRNARHQLELNAQGNLKG